MRTRWPFVDTGAEIIQAAGGLVRRSVKSPASGGTSCPLHNWQVLLVHRARHKDWSFPKGRQAPGETLEQTALREVKEETSVSCTIIEPNLPLVCRYVDRNGKLKEVHYWRMVISSESSDPGSRRDELFVPNGEIDPGSRRGELFVPNGEIDEIKWATMVEALKLLSYKPDRKLLAKIA